LKEILLQKIEAGESIPEIKKWAANEEIPLPANFESVIKSFRKSDLDRSHGKTKKGTPVHRIVFHGNETISRRMACYWRNDRRKDYNRCRKFVESLLTKPAPRAPYSDSLPPTLAPLFNEKINQYWRKRRFARAFALAFVA
jgi:hypothetical protein